MHCTEEKRERRWMQRRCYYCNQPGHQISTCEMKENDEEVQLLRLAVNAGTQKSRITDAEFQSGQRKEFIVTGTDGGLWSEIWYVSKNLKHHFSGNLDMFKRIKNLSSVETNTGENHFFFKRGIGVTEIMSGMENIWIQSVFYTPDIDRNVLSLDQLITQGYTVKFNGDTCKFFPTFSVPLFNKRSGKTGMTREEEVGMLEKESVLNREDDHERFKNEFLNDYFEGLDVSSNEPDWNVLILQSMSFKEFNDCKALLNMLEDEDYFVKYRYHLDIKFNEMIDWFLKAKLEIFTRPLPAYASENRKVCLLDLYMSVKREGGH
ncbi:putative transcription factor interactor and regulator CCHC(Zn) family [Helianthus annuus]|uniref:Putative zinc finger, CCHC-type n=1 Tax=Helianthus annuus TaxID=4232 RepID=A0A251V2D3_HELAN|nr:putative transcription factor interactor and regulator CCHC(Zn) family [Helianthus annuus]KAJ0582481.1 putative transcription factor interactor and regulator CCHC(Zn) family [Helianthus annuus]KAJ0590738.1 putative transcription factor interactor and regulator CCHC(Zn) family [Helianthus annuus]KAJ0759068.1 putative transcription factor interactor and regulator CCHC(Zn) family [Helianthus annuus]KAJ0762720.1 putative transcription factor interactor and regulator CCHC(Zn) family [Helianthus a